jgi:hypothetical protein
LAVELDGASDPVITQLAARLCYDLSHSTAPKGVQSIYFKQARRLLLARVDKVGWESLSDAELRALRLLRSKQLESTDAKKSDSSTTSVVSSSASISRPSPTSVSFAPTTPISSARSEPAQHSSQGEDDDQDKDADESCDGDNDEDGNNDEGNSDDDESGEPEEPDSWDHPPESSYTSRSDLLACVERLHHSQHAGIMDLVKFQQEGKKAL